MKNLSCLVQVGIVTAFWITSTFADDALQTQLKNAIERDSSIPDDQWRSMDVKNKTIRPNEEKNKTLTFWFMSYLAPTPPTKSQFEELEVFETSNPRKVTDEIERKPNRFTIIHADRIEQIECHVNDDNGTASGTFSFHVPELYKGKISYIAEKRNADWVIVAFQMPAYHTRLIRDGSTWHIQP